MITCRTLNLQTVDRHQCDQPQISTKPTAKLLSRPDNRQLWFFFGVAPLAVLAGWSLVAISLTGDWAWELPLGLVFAAVGSMIALVSTSMRV